MPFFVIFSGPGGTPEKPQKNVKNAIFWRQLPAKRFVHNDTGFRRGQNAGGGWPASPDRLALLLFLVIK